MSKTLETLTASDFEMKWDADHTFSFTESENAVIMAYGHPDPAELSKEIAEYDRLCAGADDIEEYEPDIWQTYAILVDGKPGDDWQIKWGQDATAPGSFPVSVVAR